MAQHSKSTPVLLPQLFTLLAAHRPAVRQERTSQRLGMLAVGLLCAFCRHTLTQVLVALGLGDRDWSAAYRLFSTPRVAVDQLYRCFLLQTLPHVPADQPYLVALDGVQVPRRSVRMPGTSWLHDPHSPPFRRGIHRAQRFSHLAWLTPPTPAGYARALPLRWLAAFPEKAVRTAGMVAAKEWEAGLASLTWLRGELNGAGRAAQRILAVADGLYSTQPVWRGLPAGVSLLARCAQNRALFDLPAPSAGRGRPRKYGERAPTPQAWLEERRGWTTTRLAVRGRQVPCTYRVAGPYLVRGAPTQPLYLLVVRGLDRVRRGHRRQRRPAFWLVSAVQQEGAWVLPWPAERLLGWAWQRWEIEVTHRELKCGFGIGESQCWNPTATVLSVQWRVWVWSVLVLSAYRVWGIEWGPQGNLPRHPRQPAARWGSPPRPLGGWWAGSGRWSFGQLWQGVRAELWELHDFPQQARRITDNRPENRPQTPAWEAAALGARRG
jgi:hypothetical protein